MEVIVPSFSGARSAEQPQSPILQFRQTQDGSGEHLTDAWPHQDTPSGSLGGARVCACYIRAAAGTSAALGVQGE